MFAPKVDLYCRECRLTFNEKEGLEHHFLTCHAGYRQPPVDLTQAEFEKIPTWSMGKQAHTCPVCLTHWRYMPNLVSHVLESHPPRLLITPLAHTDPNVLQEWGAVVHRHFGQTAGSLILENCFHRSCPRCSITFATFEECVEHIMQQHKSIYLKSRVFRAWSRSLTPCYPSTFHYPY
ncbi:hypothetical protein B9Z55_021856 [Caenorhabditis nigoni]|nr:hypothetical protein B9Z55_021856 [Caenorhabditis nigoni]